MNVHVYVTSLLLFQVDQVIELAGELEKQRGKVTDTDTT